MAVVAHRAVMGNREVRVVKRRSEPAAGGVATIAGRWVSRCDVIRNRAAERLRTVPLRLVASIAGRVRRSE